MDDALLLNRAIAGDLDSFGQLYDAYFGRIYDFAWRTLRDPDQASAATQAVFRRVARNLRNAAKAPSFAAWIFGIAHANVTGRAGAGGASERGSTPVYEEAFGAFEAPDPCRLEDPRLAEADPELPCQVWEAAASLSPRDYSLIDLHLRQHLEPGELAPIIGAGRGNAAVMIERLERAASAVIGTYVLARRGPEHCEELRQILSGQAFPPLTSELRAQIDAHAASCDACRKARSLPVPPLRIFAALSPVAAPFVLKGEIWRALVADWPQDGEDLPIGVPLPAPMGASAAGYAATAALPFEMGGGDGGGGYDQGGTGFFGDESRRNMLLFAGAAAGMLIVAFVAGAFVLRAFGSGGGGGGVAGTATRSAEVGTATSRTTLTPGVSIETPTPRASETPGPTDTPVPPPPDTPTPPPPPPPPPPTIAPTHTPPKATPTPAKSTPTRTKTPTR